MDVLPSLLPLLFVLVLVYSFGVVPRRRKLAKHAAMIEGMAAGDIATTSGGVRGRVIGRKGALITIEVAPGVRFDIEPASVESVSAPVAPVVSAPAGPRAPAPPGSRVSGRTRCPRCGGAILPDDRFCGVCGTTASPR